MALLGASIALFAYTKLIEKPAITAFQKTVQVLKWKRQELI